MDRRDFISRIGRWMLAGGLIGTSGYLFYHKRVGNPEDCYVNPYCKRCRNSNSCTILASVKSEGNERKEEE